VKLIVLVALLVLPFIAVTIGVIIVSWHWCKEQKKLRDEGFYD
jgi:hypothetical protein